MNAGKYNRRIAIYEVVESKDTEGFPSGTQNYQLVLSCYADVKTTKGMTLITNDSDFEKAYTRFLIRYPVSTISRKMVVLFNNKYYTIEYINNVDEANVELELQCKEVRHDG